MYVLMTVKMKGLMLHVGIMEHVKTNFAIAILNTVVLTAQVINLLIKKTLKCKHKKSLQYDLFQCYSARLQKQSN